MKSKSKLRNCFKINKKVLTAGKGICTTDTSYVTGLKSKLSYVTVSKNQKNLLLEKALVLLTDISYVTGLKSKYMLRNWAEIKI